MKKSFLLAAAALVAFSCSKREMGYDPYEADPNEVKFSWFGRCYARLEGND